MAAKNQSGRGKGGGGGIRSGGTSGSTTKPVKPKSNVIKMSTRKPMSAAEQKARAGLDRIKKSPAAEDVRNRNLNNLKKTFGKPKVTRKNNSPFGPVASGKVTPKGKGPRGR